tara:strand:- start:101 stop:1453 length:1353 start_codon:yes stop_codon:yes gene_type:complete
MYNKRIAFLMSYQHLIPHGGIGQFALSFVKQMKDNNVKVDIITDKFDKHTEFTKTLQNDGARFIYTDNPLPYSKHQGIFMYGDSYCLERMINFRNSVIKALESNLYDSIVCNTYETSRLMSEIGLEDCIQIINYTHLESQLFENTKNPFLDNVNESMRLQMLMPNTTIGTQSEFNSQILGTKKGIHLPIPLPEPSLLEEHHKERTGVLFIGRWEEGKGPEDFLKVIESTKLPAKVMTNANGAKKFEARLKEMGAEYEIKYGIIGQEKVNFITSARVAFNPSTVESYGIAFLEQHIQLPTVAYEGMRWLKNFNDKYYYTGTKESVAMTINVLYKEFPTAESYYQLGSLKHYNEQENLIASKWLSCFDSFTSKQSNTSTAGILKHTTTSHADYITSLNRNTICIDDVRSVLTNKHKFNIIYTDTDTWLTTDEGFTPAETVSTTQSAQLFEGL